MISIGVIGFCLLIVVGAVLQHAASTREDAPAGVDESDDRRVVY